MVTASPCLPAPGDIGGALAEVPGVCLSLLAPWAPEVIQLRDRARGQVCQGVPCCWNGAKPPGGIGSRSVLGLGLQVSGWGTRSSLSPVTWAPHIGHAFLAPAPGSSVSLLGWLGVGWVPTDPGTAQPLGWCLWPSTGKAVALTEAPQGHGCRTAVSIAAIGTERHHRRPSWSTDRCEAQPCSGFSSLLSGRDGLCVWPSPGPSS